ncbi:hypothetical protein V8C86DRAFT_2441405 [Haematococcus lacustris]
MPSPAQPSPAQPSPAQPSPAQPSPAQPSPAQPSPAQPSPAQPSPAQPSPAQPSPTLLSHTALPTEWGTLWDSEWPQRLHHGPSTLWSSVSQPQARLLKAAQPSTAITLTWPRHGCTSCCQTSRRGAGAAIAEPEVGAGLVQWSQCCDGGCAGSKLLANFNHIQTPHFHGGRVPNTHWSSVSQHQARLLKVAAGSLAPAMIQHRQHAQRQCSDLALATGTEHQTLP